MILNKEICNSLSGYIETLYYLNQKLIMLCGINISNEYDCAQKQVIEIIQDIPRLIPYIFNRKSKKLELTGENGLLEYKNEIIYLEKIYVDILSDNYTFLNDVRKIRNKYEHKMHDIRRKFSGSGTTTYFEFGFLVSGKYITITAIDLIKLIKELNKLFSLLVDDIKKSASEIYKENVYDFPYYRRLLSFNFLDFNKIYDDELLRVVARIMRDF